MNYAHILKKYRALWPEKTFIVDGEKRLTYEDVDKRVNALAQGLLNRGIQSGDRVATFVYNRAECFEIFLAACKIGAAYVALNFRLAPAEVVYILNDSGAKLFFSEEELGGPLEGIRDQVPVVQEYIAVDPEVPTGWTSYEGIIEENRGAQVPDAEVGFDHLQRLMYTSGTTAHPKGVMLTHNNVYCKGFAHILALGHHSEEVVLICGPLYHVGGMDVGATSVMLLGGTLVIMKRFDPEKILQTIDREKVTFMWAAPSMVKMLFDSPNFDKYDTSSIRVIPTGGEKTPLPLIEESKRRLPSTVYIDGFGMTETVSGDILLDQIANPDKIGSVGNIRDAVFGVEIRIVDDNGVDVKPGQPGEMILKGPKVFKAYWKKQEVTAESFEDGWFHTGDVAQLDEEGYVYIVDRKKDMIISGGENVGSLEVEKVLEQHPKVKEVAVVGVPHEKWGETVKAVVVVNEAEDLTPEELIKFCDGKLARFKIPKLVEFIDALPRTVSGKVLKYKLRDQASKSSD